MGVVQVHRQVNACLHVEAAAAAATVGSCCVGGCQTEEKTAEAVGHSEASRAWRAQVTDGIKDLNSQLADLQADMSSEATCHARTCRRAVSQAQNDSERDLLALRASSLKS